MKRKQRKKLLNKAVFYDVNVSGYFCTIYSEAEGKCFTEALDMIVENPESIINFIVESETYGDMVDACKNIIDTNQALLESLN